MDWMTDLGCLYRLMQCNAKNMTQHKLNFNKHLFVNSMTNRRQLYHFTASYICWKKKKTTPNILKIPHGSNLFAACFVFHHLWNAPIYRRNAQVCLEQEKATYFYSNLVQIDCWDSAFLKEIKRTEYKPLLFLKLHFKRPYVPSVYSFNISFIAFSLYSWVKPYTKRRKLIIQSEYTGSL